MGLLANLRTLPSDASSKVHYWGVASIVEHDICGGDLAFHRTSFDAGATFRRDGNQLVVRPHADVSHIELPSLTFPAQWLETRYGIVAPTRGFRTDGFSNAYVLLTYNPIDERTAGEFIYESLCATFSRSLVLGSESVQLHFQHLQ